LAATGHVQVCHLDPEELHEFELAKETGTSSDLLSDPAIVDRSYLLRSTFAGPQNIVHSLEFRPA
jgi:hypothetical protein